MAESPSSGGKGSLRPRQAVLIALLLLAVIAGLVLAVHSALERLPVGADFYTFWLAGRAAFLDHQNPYGSQVTLQSQIGIYGRPAFPTEDQVAFAYPPYSLFLLAPLTAMEYPWAESIWLIANILLIVSIIYLAFPKAPKWLPFSFLLFYPVVFGLILGNFVVAISAFLILFYGFFVARKNPPLWLQILTGVFLAWSTIKPQFLWLFLVFILMIAFRNKYRAFLISLAASWMLLFLLSFLLVPGWLPLWLGRIREYAGYVRSSPTILNLLSLIFPHGIALGLTAVLAFAIFGLTAWLVYLWFRGRFSDLHLFLWVGLATYFLHPHGISYEQLCLLVPLLCWVGSLSSPKAWVYTLTWFTPLALSWLVFIVSKWVFPPIDELPLIYFSLLFGWILLSKTSRGFNQSISSN